MLEWPIFTHLKFTWFCNVPCQMASFLYSHPSLTTEPGHFLKIYGEILPCSRPAIPRGFPHYWITGGLRQTPFYLTFIAWRDFSHMPFPHLCPAYLHFALPVKFFLNSFLGVGAWGWVEVGVCTTTHETGFWQSVLEGSACLNNASSQICL